MASERRELTRIAALVEREEDQRQTRVIPEDVEQRFQGTDIIRAGRDVGALVASVCIEQPAVVVAKRARMDLHHQAVIDAHARHLGQHLGPEEFGIGGIGLAVDHPAEQGSRFVWRKVGGCRGRMPMIG